MFATSASVGLGVLACSSLRGTGQLLSDEASAIVILLPGLGFKPFAGAVRRWRFVLGHLAVARFDPIKTGLWLLVAPTLAFVHLGRRFSYPPGSSSGAMIPNGYDVRRVSPPGPREWYELGGSRRCRTTCSPTSDERGNALPAGHGTARRAWAGMLPGAAHARRDDGAGGRCHVWHRPHPERFENMAISRRSSLPRRRGRQLLRRSRTSKVDSCCSGPWRSVGSWSHTIKRRRVDASAPP
jgi:hypothetical protein